MNQGTGLTLLCLTGLACLIPLLSNTQYVTASHDGPEKSCGPVLVLRRVLDQCPYLCEQVRSRPKMYDLLGFLAAQSSSIPLVVRPSVLVESFVK